MSDLDETIHAALMRTLPLPLLAVMALCIVTSAWWQASLLVFVVSALLSGALSGLQFWAVKHRRRFPHGLLRAALECAAGCAMAWSTGAAGTGWVSVLPAIISLPLVLPGWRSRAAVGSIAVLVPAASYAGGAPEMMALTATVVLGVVAFAHEALVGVLQRHYGAALQQSQAATRAKSSFLAHISHEIRTPLNGLLGVQQLLQQSTLTPVQEHLVEISLRSGSGLLGVLNAVLDLSKIEAGSLELEQVPMQPRKLLVDALDSMRPLAASKGLALTAQLSPELPTWTRGDPTRLRQIVLNLLSNALKFTAEGSVTLSAGWAAGTLEITVADTGIGIPGHKLGAIFEAFTQADASTTRQYGGTGLGLALSQQLVAQQGGQIGVDSTVGQGSTFWFRLPMAACDAEAAEPTAPQSVRPCRVLLVEDNPINQLVASRMLEADGHTVTVAGNGLEALDVWDRTRAEAVLMDCQMPQLDGLETTRRLRARGVTVPIIALTANAFESDRRACLAAGMSDFLSKPLERAALRAALQRALPRDAAPDQATA